LNPIKWSLKRIIFLMFFSNITPHTNTREGGLAMKKYLFRDEGMWALQHLEIAGAEPAWNEFVSGLFEAFGWAFNDNIDIVNHSLESLAGRLQEINCGWNTISIDPCIGGDIDVGISRVFLPGGKVDIGIAARPGFSSLAEQFSAIPRGEYVLLEDDIFSGGTIRQVITSFSQYDVSIKKLVCGFQVGEPSIDDPIVALERYSSEMVVDLNDPRDFLAGAYKGGLVIQYPDKAYVRVPYVLPFVDSEARSSIPRQKVLEFSKKIWRLNIGFWEKFQQIKLQDAEPFFYLMLQRWGYTGEETMLSVCEDMLDLLDFPKVSVACENDRNAIFLDLNGTLITSNTGELNSTSQEIAETIGATEEKGWSIGLCSDSPHLVLKEWGQARGIKGPVVSENGRLLDNEPIFSQTPSILQDRGVVEEWAKKKGLSIFSDVTAPEFGGSQPNDTGIAFGAGRVCSTSVFCFKQGLAYPGLTIELGAFLEELDVGSIDCSPQHGFIAIHEAGDFRCIKGRILRAIGYALYLLGRECWMVGDSLSDIVSAPALCKFASVGNAQETVKQAADLVAESSYTKGVLELIRAISSHD